MLTVYTVAIGDTDPVQAPEVIDPTVRYLCFSDRPCPAPYEWIEVPTEADGTPESRRYKVLADHPELEAANETLYHDASYRLTGDLQWVHRGFQLVDLVAMRHPRRTRIEDEAVAIARWGYVTPEEGAALVAEYREAGYDEQVVMHGGLFARRRSLSVRLFNRLWWAEVQRWRYRDQASMGYAAWCACLRTGYLSGTMRDNPYAVWRQPVGVPA